MKTPNEKYNNDPAYRRLVMTMESLIAGAEFTPSEIREAAMLACIHYEMRYVSNKIVYRDDVENAFKILENYASHRQDR